MHEDLRFDTQNPGLGIDSNCHTEQGNKMRRRLPSSNFLVIYSLI